MNSQIGLILALTGLAALERYTVRTATYLDFRLLENQQENPVRKITSLKLLM